MNCTTLKQHKAFNNKQIQSSEAPWQTHSSDAWGNLKPQLNKGWSFINLLILHVYLICM